MILVVENQFDKGTHSTLLFDSQTNQEFLNYLLDVLHEDSNKIKNKPSVEALEDDWVKANSLARVGEEAWRRCVQCTRYETLKSITYSTHVLSFAPQISQEKSFDYGRRCHGTSFKYRHLPSMHVF